MNFMEFNIKISIKFENNENLCWNNKTTGKNLVIIIIQFHKFRKKHPENWTLFKEFLMTFMASNVEILILFKNNENLYNDIQNLSVCLCVCVCVWPPFFSVLRYDRNSRLVSLEPVWPEECPSKKKENLPKYYQWRNYGQKTTPPMLFLWGKFCASCSHVWNAIISQTFSTNDEF
jgi:hypothetical protein